MSPDILNEVLRRERAAKRLRVAVSDCCDDFDAADPRQERASALPPELWARAMEYVPFETMLSCAATCRAMLHERIPLVKTVRIEKSSHMNVVIASRFRDAKDIYIDSLFCLNVEDDGSFDEYQYVEVDLETKIRVVPFLSRFAKLDRVFFRATKDTGEVVDDFAPVTSNFFDEPNAYPDDSDESKLMNFIDLFSGAFCCGALQKHVQISGLSCSNKFLGNTCKTCRRACNCFPLGSVIDFESRGSSYNHVLSGRSYNLDVCLDRGTIESIVENRPKGHALLHSERRLLKLLGSARLYKVDIVDGERALYIAKYESGLIDEMKRVIKYAELDVSALSSETISGSIMKSFAGQRATVPMDQRCISKETLDHLGSTLEICIATDDFQGPFNVPGNVKQIAMALMHGRRIDNFLEDDEEDNEIDSEEDSEGDWEEYRDIQMDCVLILRQFLETEKDFSIQHIIDMVPSLNIFCGHRSVEYLSKATQVLESIIRNTTDGQRKAVIEAGSFPPFAGLLEPPEPLEPPMDHIVTSALASLSGIIADVTQEHMERMVKAGIIPSLIGLLDSTDSDSINNSLGVLTVLADYFTENAISSGVLPQLFALIRSADNVLVSNSLILLRKFLESDHPPVQEVIGQGIISCLLEILKTTKDDDVIQANLAYIIIDLASHESIEQRNSLVQVPGFLSALQKLQKYSCSTISWLASLAVENIAIHVDSDEDSDVSFEEAEEVAFEQVMSADKSRFVLDFGHLNHKEAPTLMGLPDNVLEKIIYLAVERVGQVCVLERTCRRICKMTTSSDEFWTHLPAAPRSRHKVVSTRTRREVFEIDALGKIQLYQKAWRGNAILCSLDDEMFIAEAARTLSANLLSRMIRAGSEEVQFRLRGDTIAFLFELLEGYMVARLEEANLLALHSDRTEVQVEDVLLVFRKLQSTPDFSLPCPSMSGTDWHWPADDFDALLPQEVGCRIIRTLAYVAGIVVMSGDAFVLAEIELFRAMGVLLVDSFESSVEAANTATFLSENDTLIYKSTESRMALGSATHDDDEAIDMFKSPPPPFCDPYTGISKEAVVDTDNILKGPIFTVVPGHITAAAGLRGIRPSKVCGNVWTASPGFSSDQEMEIEMSYYYKPFYCDDSDTNSDEDTISRYSFCPR